MSKSDIKHDVFRRAMATSVRAIRKYADESRGNCIPRPETDDPGQTLDNATFVIEDTSLALHKWTNVDRDSSSLTGFRVSAVTGDAFAHFLLGSVKKAFEHRRVHTVILCIDKDAFVIRPKFFTQKNRTVAIQQRMEKMQIEPIQFNPDGSVPVMIARNKIIPPWPAVLANRTLLRHAVNQTIELMLEYKPPAGRRLIIDALDMSATSPATLDQWMRSNRLMISDFGSRMIERARSALKKTGETDNTHYDEARANWRTHVALITKELAQGGHIMSIPLCVETDDEGTTYAPFLLPYAANNCGEGDVGALFWLYSMEADRQHVTLFANRALVPLIDDAHAAYYSDEQLALNRELHEKTAAQPLSVAERLAKARALIAKSGDILLNEKPTGTVRAAIAEGIPRNAANVCRDANRGLVLSCDTDFPSLMVQYYAGVCYNNRERDDTQQYCLDNAPLLAMGECRVHRTGWLASYDDFYIAPPKKRKRAAAAGGGDGDDDDDDEVNGGGVDEVGGAAAAPEGLVPLGGIIAHEMYDMHRFYLSMLERCGKDLLAASPLTKLNCALSFATFCASCQNDYIAGVYGVNRQHMFKAFLDVGASLTKFHERLALPIIDPVKYQTYLKRCYYESLESKAGKKNKPMRAATATTYAEIRRLTQAKYKGEGERSVKSRAMEDDTMQLVYERLTFCAVYAWEGWLDINGVLDDTVWGWQPGTIDIMV